MKTFEEWSMEPIPSMPDGEPVPKFEHATIEIAYNEGTEEGRKAEREELLKFMQEFIEHEYHEVRDVEFYFENWKMKRRRGEARYL